MKRVVFLLIVFFSIGGSSSVQGYPRDFNFILEYGVLNKNRLNTFDQTYKKDLVMDGEVTTKRLFALLDGKALAIVGHSLPDLVHCLIGRGNAQEDRLTASSAYEGVGL